MLDRALNDQGYLTGPLVTLVELFIGLTLGGVGGFHVLKEKKILPEPCDIKLLRSYSGVYTMTKIVLSQGFFKHRKYFFVIKNAIA